MNNLRVVNCRDKTFKMQSDPIDYQITKHFINLLLTYNYSQNVSRENVAYLTGVSLFPNVPNTQYILTVFRTYILIPDAAANDTLDFRCKQIVHYYGPNKIARWIVMFYGEKIVC